MRMGQGVRTGLGHGGITGVLQTQFSSFLFFFFFFFANLREREMVGRLLYIKFVKTPSTRS